MPRLRRVIVLPSSLDCFRCSATRLRSFAVAGGDGIAVADKFDAMSVDMTKGRSKE